MSLRDACSASESAMTTASSCPIASRQLARLALAVEHPGRQRVTLPALDAAVGVKHRAVEGDEGGAPPAARGAELQRATSRHDESVAHERAHEGFVLRRERGSCQSSERARRNPPRSCCRLAPASRSRRRRRAVRRRWSPVPCRVLRERVEQRRAPLEVS